jgi:hypothetical protein
MTKQTVHYVAADADIFPIRVGYSAFVYPRDHTSSSVSNRKLSITSPVISYDETTGQFETLNSIYVLVK